MNHFLRTLFYLVVVRPMMVVILGMNIRRYEDLPDDGPAIIVANHNSHLDVFALMHVLGLKRLHRVRPVAAANYFMTRPIRRWFATRIVGIIPIDREQTRRCDGKHPLQPISDALDRGDIVILFPEGTRGEPEEMGPLQPGIAHLAKRHPEVPVVPVFMRGLGRAMPKGEAMIVPSMCDVFVGDPIPLESNKRAWMNALRDRMQRLEMEATYRLAT